MGKQQAKKKQRDMFTFMSKGIRKELESKKKELRKSYRMANKDEGQMDATDLWQGTLADGSQNIE